MNYKQKYFKYKKKYLDVKKQIGGNNKIYDFIENILSNTFLTLKKSEKVKIIKLLGMDCISLVEILGEAYDYVKVFEERLEAPEKIELNMIKESINPKIESDFLLKLGATQEILDYLRMDPNQRIYKQHLKDTSFIYDFFQIEKILKFSIQEDNQINFQIGELIWKHLTFLCEKYFYLLNLYKKYKITSTIFLFNEVGISKLCLLFDNNQKCLKIDNLCEWKDEKCKKKIVTEDTILFNEDYDDDDDYEEYKKKEKKSNYPNLSKINYNTRLMNKIYKNFPFNFIQFFLNTKIIYFKMNSNRNKDNQKYLFHRIGDYSENLFCNIRNSIEELKKKITLKSEEITKLDLIRNKDFFIKKGVNIDDYDYYINDPKKKIYTEDDDRNIWKSNGLRFYNTEIYYILEFALKVGDINTKILEIYWIHMIDLCNIYYYLIHLYEKYKIPFTKQLVDINKVCINMKDKSKCNQSEFCNWNERGELNKQCEKKPIRWN